MNGYSAKGLTRYYSESSYSSASGDPSVLNSSNGSFLTNASNEYFTSDDASLLNTQIKGTGQKFTMEIWCKRVRINNTYQTIFSRDNNTGGRQFACEFDPNNKWTFFIADDASNYSWWKSDSTYAVTNIWYHFVMVFDNTQALANKFTGYVNGSPVAFTRTDLGAGVANVNDQAAEPIYINVTNFGGLINPFEGYLSQLAFYNGALTQADVTVLYNNGNAASNRQSSTSVPCYMSWNAAQSATFGGTNWVWDDNVGTTYPVSKSFTSSNMDAATRSTSIFPTTFAGYNSASQTLFSAMSTTPTDFWKQIIDDFISGSVDDGNFVEIDAMWMLAAETQQASTLNWKSPSTFTLTEMNTPTWAQFRGYTGNGSNMHLKTGFNPATNGVKYVLNSASIGTYLRLNINLAQATIGNLSGSDAAIIVPRNAGTFAGRVNSATNNTVALANSTGLIVARRTASNAQALYRNGASLSTGVGVSTSVVSSEMYIMAYNNGGTATLPTTNQVAFAFIASGAIDQAKLYTRVQNYMYAIGAAI